MRIVRAFKFRADVCDITYGWAEVFLKIYHDQRRFECSIGLGHAGYTTPTIETREPRSGSILIATMGIAAVFNGKLESTSLDTAAIWARPDSRSRFGSKRLQKVIACKATHNLAS